MRQTPEGLGWAGGKRWLARRLPVGYERFQAGDGPSPPPPPFSMAFRSLLLLNTDVSFNPSGKPPMSS